MTNKQFDEMLDKLHELGLASGDLGYAYWSNIIQELKEMRFIASDYTRE